MPLWTILTKWPAARRAGVDVAPFGAIVAAIAARGARDVADARRERIEDRVQPAHDLLASADHQAEAALHAPDAARSADIDIVDAARRKRLRAADIVLVEAVAAIDDDCAGFGKAAELLDRRLGGIAGRQHHPEDGVAAQLIDEIGERGGGGGAVGDQGCDRRRVAVPDHCLMSGPHQAPRDAAAHSAKTDDSDAHERAFQFSGESAAVTSRPMLASPASTSPSM